MLRCPVLLVGDGFEPGGFTVNSMANRLHQTCRASQRGPFRGVLARDRLLRCPHRRATRGAAVRADIDSVYELLDEVRGTVADLDAKVDAGFAAVTAKIDAGFAEILSRLDRP